MIAHKPFSGSLRTHATRFQALTIVAAWMCSWPIAADFQGSTHMMPFDEEALQYSKTTDQSRVAQLQTALRENRKTLPYDPKFGFLPALLHELGISTNSQMLVFSKTSFQRERISPQTPRAIYFGDDTYVGYIPGAPLLEISAVDPNLGAVFYTLEQKPRIKPEFVRTDQCLECHASAKSMGVPGHLVRSFFTDKSGVVDLVSGISPVTHRTPLAERWGGWYVTGQHGSQTHRGNKMQDAGSESNATPSTDSDNVMDLRRFFDTTPYLAQGSDMVALMVLEHQTHLHNFLTRLHYAATLALQQYGHVNYLKNVIEAFIKYLLFTEEVQLTSRISGSSEFAKWFSRQGPFDHQGRSLREFDLKQRMFKYPCSFLIYSGAFEALPSPVKARIYQRLWEILTNLDRTDDFNRLTPESKRAILEILLETKSELPQSWKLDRIEIPPNSSP